MTHEKHMRFKFQSIDTVLPEHGHVHSCLSCLWLLLQFLLKVESYCPPFPYHTAVQWLSSGKVYYDIFCVLRTKIKIFLNKKHPQPPQFQQHLLNLNAKAGEMSIFKNPFNCTIPNL